MTGKPATAGVYLRHYNDDTSDEWLADYWDGEHWYFSAGGMICKMQGREWRVLTTKGE